MIVQHSIPTRQLFQTTYALRRRTSSGRHLLSAMMSTGSWNHYHSHSATQSWMVHKTGTHFLAFTRNWAGTPNEPLTGNNQYSIRANLKDTFIINSIVPNGSSRHTLDEASTPR